MADGPTIWNINDDIIIDLLLVDPNSYRWLTGQASNITLRIRRGSDNLYWNGTSWVSGSVDLSFTEFNSTYEPGRYVYTLSGTTANTTADIYYAYADISNPPTIEGTVLEVHVSRDTDVNLYESEPVPRC